MGFFLQRQGQYGAFLYTDPTDTAVVNGAIAQGDGSTATFSFIRYMGPFFEPVGWVTSVSNVYLNGVNQASGWSVSTPNALVFASAPGAGVAISATFAFAFQCRFNSDDMDFEQFMSALLEGRQPQVQIGEDIMTTPTEDWRPISEPPAAGLSGDLLEHGLAGWRAAI